MISFLKLIRYQNLLLIALMQLIFRYGFLQLQNVPLALHDWQFILLVLATVCIAGAGYLINDVYDLQTDTINKPKDVIIEKYISETKAYNIYIVLNILGVGIGFYLSNAIGRPSLAAIFIFIAYLLYLYAASLKQNLLIGNFVIALLTAISVLIIGIFDLYPMINPDNKILLGTIFQVLLDYALFAFMINFIREIVKDMEDIDGDAAEGMNTLPIVLGVAKTSKLVFALSIFPTLLVFYYVHEYYFKNQLLIATLYALVFIIAPLIYFNIKVATAKTKSEFHHLSTMLKLIVFFGIVSVVVISLNVKYNA